MIAYPSYILDSHDKESTLAEDSATPPPSDPFAKVHGSPVFVSVINELNVNTDQLNKRRSLIDKIEKELTSRYGCPNKLITYFLRFGHARTLMHTTDIPQIETLLSSLKNAEQINILLHSPGGDGTIVEKMVEMCRAHLSGNNKKLRIIVPNIAKSAATLLTLGADEIIMGYCSELGPIDPQVPTAVSGQIQWVSAFAFVEARDKLMKQIGDAIKKNEPTVGHLQQLAGLNIPFTDEMENQIGFAKKTATTLLSKYMLKPKHPNATRRNKKANDIAKKLLSKQLFPSHGHYIDGSTSKQLGLTVELLDKDNVLWKLIWDYYIRCEVQMNIPVQPPMIKTKLFEAGNNVSLIVQDMP